VRALVLRYFRAFSRFTAAGITWSSPPAMNSSGARLTLVKSTRSGVFGATFANAPWNNTFAAAGTWYRS
jgi:hypothetical protein